MNTNRFAIAEIIELLSKKWVMRIIWELRAETLTFRQLQHACDDVSPTVLNQRLKLLKASQILVLENQAGYQLTDIGRELLEVYKPLSEWAQRWQAQLGNQ